MENNTVSSIYCLPPLMEVAIQNNITVKKKMFSKASTTNVSDTIVVMGAPIEWKNGTDGKGIVVALLDTGIDRDHPALSGKVLHQRDYVDDGKHHTNYHYHGTHVAGIIAANGILKGVAPGVSLFDYRVLDSNGIGSSGNIAQAIVDATKDKVNIIFMPFVGSTPDDNIEQAIKQAVNNNIVVIGCAHQSGNNITMINSIQSTETTQTSTVPIKSFPPPTKKVVVTKTTVRQKVRTGLSKSSDSVKQRPSTPFMEAKNSTSKPLTPAVVRKVKLHIDYPAYYKQVIAVGAVNYDPEKGISHPPIFTSFYNDSDEVDVIGHGYDVLSCIPNSRYARLTGVSLAAAHVVGYTALIIQKENARFSGNPRTISENEIFAILQNNTINSFNGTFQKELGFVSLYPTYLLKNKNKWSMVNLE